MGCPHHGFEARKLLHRLLLGANGPAVRGRGMNLFWVAIIAAFVLIEKIVPYGHWVSKASGLVLIGWGIWMIIMAP